MTAGLYALVVFLAGCVLGTLRELPVVPWLGRALALWIELPVMIVVCHEVADRVLVRGTNGFAVGVIALPMLLGLETTLAALLRGASPAGHWLMDQEVGALTLTVAGLTIFTTMPTFVARRKGSVTADNGEDYSPGGSLPSARLNSD